MSSPSTFECFGLVIHGYNADEALKRIDQNISEGRASMIVTANPEILLEAKNNSAYWNVLRQADLRLVDGIALKFAGWLAGTNPKRLTGVDLAERLLQESVQRGWKVALLGAGPGVADKAAWDIRKAYPELSVLSEQGGKVGKDGEDDETGADARFRLTQYAPDVLFVALSFPGQESWIARYLADFPSVKIAIGVGGTFDYWAGEKKRAPKFLQSIGLEWLWRLIKEPSRWKRIVRAVIIFPFVYLFS